MSNEIKTGCAAMPQPEISQEAARAMLAALRAIADGSECPFSRHTARIAIQNAERGA